MTSFIVENSNIADSYHEFENLIKFKFKLENL